MVAWALRQAATIVADSGTVLCDEAIDRSLLIIITLLNTLSSYKTIIIYTVRLLFLCIFEVFPNYFKKYKMKHLLSPLFFVVFLGFFASMQAQDCSTGRYITPVFNDVDIDFNVDYGQAVQPTIFNPNATQTLDMDIYRPIGDTMTARPLIIWAYGGSFVVGSPLSPDIVTLCNRFSEMGYVNASIDYRLSTDLLFDNSTQNAYEAVMKASHDMKAAIRFFYKDAATTNQYKIDTNQIFIGGVSAGAIAALHVAYLDEQSEVPALIATEFANNGGLEGNSGNAGYSCDVAGVINLCGALLDTTWIKECDEPVVSMHGDQDGTVPYGSAPITTLGINLDIDGSFSIHEKADQLGLHNDFYTWQGAGHTPFISNSLYMDTTVMFVKDFLHTLVCPQPTDVYLKAILEGPHQGNGQMTTALVPFMPLASPYSQAPYNAPAVTATSIPTNAVDWVLVEVRTGDLSPTLPKTSKIIAQQSAFLLSDGTIVGLDGVSPLTFDLLGGEKYHFAIRNRNHLDIVTSEPTRQFNSVITYDFTTAMTQAFGTQQLKIDNGFAVMHAGDITQDHTIQITDFDEWRLMPAVLNTYHLSDTNHDATVQTTDYDLWLKNKAKLGHAELGY